jgi:hypothetical protein
LKNHYLYASQEFPLILWDTEVHCRIHNSPPVVILCEIKLVHATMSHSFNISLILTSHLCLGLPSGRLP